MPVYKAEQPNPPSFSPDADALQNQVAQPKDVISDATPRTFSEVTSAESATIIPDGSQHLTTAAKPAHGLDMDRLKKRYGGDPSSCPYLKSLGQAGIDMYEKFAAEAEKPDRPPTMAELLAARNKQTPAASDVLFGSKSIPVREPIGSSSDKSKTTHQETPDDTHSPQLKISPNSHELTAEDPLPPADEGHRMKVKVSDVITEISAKPHGAATRPTPEQKAGPEVREAIPAGPRLRTVPAVETEDPVARFVAPLLAYQTLEVSEVVPERPVIIHDVAEPPALLTTQETHRAVDRSLTALSAETYIYTERRDNDSLEMPEEDVPGATSIVAPDTALPSAIDFTLEDLDIPHVSSDVLSGIITEPSSAVDALTIRVSETASGGEQFSDSLEFTMIGMTLQEASPILLDTSANDISTGAVSPDTVMPSEKLDTEVLAATIEPDINPLSEHEAQTIEPIRQLSGRQIAIVEDSLQVLRQNASLETEPHTPVEVRLNDALEAEIKTVQDDDQPEVVREMAIRLLIPYGLEKDEDAIDLVLDLINPVIAKRLEYPEAMTIEQKNNLGTREYRAGDDGIPAASLFQMIKNALSPHLRIGRYVLSVSST